MRLYRSLASLWSPATAFQSGLVVDFESVIAALWDLFLVAWASFNKGLAFRHTRFTLKHWWLTQWLQAQILTPPLPCLAVGMKCLCWWAVFGFCQTALCILVKNHHSSLVFPTDIVPLCGLLWFKRLSPGSLFKQATFIQSFFWLCCHEL